jgi:hypothetical protein
MRNNNAASDVWLHLVSQATACLRTVGHHNGAEAILDQSLASLATMENCLLAYQNQWDDPPTHLPPTPLSQSNNGTMMMMMMDDRYMDPHAPGTTVPSTILTGNRFSSIQYDDDSTDDEKEEVTIQPLDDGGDIPVLNHTTFPSKSNRGMSMRRLMIRIVTAQSELYAKKGSACRYPTPRWVQGADLYQISLHRIRYALILADSEISRLIGMERHCSDLVEDASIVEVAIGSLTNECHAFQHAAQQQQEYLLKRLSPQWASRDVAKSQMGERWTNNPAPRNRFKAAREGDERQLQEVRAALAKMLAMDTEQAREQAEKLRSLAAGGTNQQSAQNTKKGHRYNGIRPADTTARVSWDQYPDPTDFGWNFTGSHNFVEFFEKEGIKLDWYFTTATIKTSMDHPTKGKTQLFGSKVTPEVYTKVLLDPRSHTNVRYRNRTRKPRAT